MALNPSSGWSYYKEIQISDTANVSANYQMRLKVYSGNGDDNTADGIIYCDNHCENFPNDIRFGTTNDPSTATQLAQWIEESDATSATIWVKLPSDGSDIIYMFVGNSSASQYSSGNDTFLYFEDFSSDTTSSYTSTRDSAGKGTNYTKELSVVGHGTAFLTKLKWTLWDAGRWSCTFTFGYSNKDCTDRSNPDDGVNLWLNNDSDLGASDSPKKLAWRVYATNNNTSSHSSTENPEISSDTWYKFELRSLSTSVEGKMFSDDYLELSSVSVTSNIPPDTDLQFLWFNNWDCNESGHLEEFVWDSGGFLKRHVRRDNTWSEQIIYIDWHLIRKYDSTEPTWSSFGSWTEISAGQAYETTLTDTISLSSSIQKLPSIIYFDIVVTSDDFSTFKQKGKALVELVSLIEQLAKRISIVRKDNISLQELVGFRILLSLLVSLSIVDLFSHIRRRQKLLSSTITLADSLSLGLIKYLIESLLLSDLLSLSLKLFGNLKVGTKNHSFTVWCSSWKEDNYSIVIEFIADKDSRDKLISDIVPGAVAQLYNILGEPKFIDTTYEGKNTITLTPRRGLSTLKDPVTVAVKRYAETMLRWDLFKIKLEVVRL